MHISILYILGCILTFTNVMADVGSKKVDVRLPVHRPEVVDDKNPENVNVLLSTLFEMHHNLLAQISLLEDKLKTSLPTIEKSEIKHMVAHYTAQKNNIELSIHQIQANDGADVAQSRSIAKDSAVDSKSIPLILNFFKRGQTPTPEQSNANIGYSLANHPTATYVFQGPPPPAPLPVNVQNGFPQQVYYQEQPQQQVVPQYVTQPQVVHHPQVQEIQYQPQQVQTQFQPQPQFQVQPQFYASADQHQQAQYQEAISQPQYQQQPQQIQGQYEPQFYASADQSTPQQPEQEQPSNYQEQMNQEIGQQYVPTPQELQQYQQQMQLQAQQQPQIQPQPQIQSQPQIQPQPQYQLQPQPQTQPQPQPQPQLQLQPQPQPQVQPQQQYSFESVFRPSSVPVRRPQVSEFDTQRQQGPFGQKEGIFVYYPNGVITDDKDRPTIANRFGQAFDRFGQAISNAIRQPTTSPTVENGLSSAPRSEIFQAKDEAKGSSKKTSSKQKPLVEKKTKPSSEDTKEEKEISKP